MVPRPQGIMHHEMSFLTASAGEEGLRLQAHDFAPTATSKMTKSCRDKLANMCVIHGPRLRSVAVEFTRLEAELAPDVHALAPSDQSEDTVAKLARLQFFIAHVEHTRERMEAAHEGRGEPFTMRQLTLLEQHITTALLPVMDRLAAQRQLNIAAAAAAPTGAAGGGAAAAVAAAAIPAPAAAAVAVTGSAELPGYGDVDSFLVSDRENASLLLLDGPVHGHGSPSPPTTVSAASDGSSAIGCCSDANIAVVFSVDEDKRGTLAPPGPLAAAAATAGPAAADSPPKVASVVASAAPAAAAVTGTTLTTERGVGVPMPQQQSAHPGAFLGCANAFSYGIGSDTASESEQIASPLALLEPTPVNGDPTTSSSSSSSSTRSCGDCSVITALEAMDFQVEGAKDVAVPRPQRLQSQQGADVAAAAATPQLGPVPMAVDNSLAATRQHPALQGLQLMPVASFDAAAAVAAAPPAAAVKRKAEAEPARASATSSAGAGATSASVYHGASGGAAGASAATAARTAAAGAAAAAISALYLAAGVTPEATVSVGRSAPAGAAPAGAAPAAVAAVPSRRAKRRLLPPALTAPRAVHFQCAACSEVYPSTISFNPWWALFQQQCPVCCNVQVPRVDINHPVNNNDSHMAVLSAAADADCDSGADSGGDSDSDSDSDAEDNEGGAGFGGQMLPAEQAAKLLVLMCHARTCPGVHTSARHQEVCKSIKFLMLHIRDCDGRLATEDACPCPYPWCGPCKALLQHLLQCDGGNSCAICSPSQLPQQLQELRAVAAARNAAVAAAAAPAAATMLVVPKVEAVPAAAAVLPPPALPQ